MRIATKNLFDQGMAAMQRQQAALVKTQQQLATGRRVLTPADDPVAAAESLRTSQAQDMNTQYERNQTSATNKLSLMESKLTGITELYQQIRTSLIQAGSGSQTNQDRAAIATALRANFEDLLGLANATDGNGNYLFSGNLEKTTPFAATATGATYNGDQGRRLLQVAASRQLAVGENGSALFERIGNGNGVFITGLGATNSGRALIDPGTVTNAALLTGHDYRIEFTVAAGATTYSVVDATSSATLSSGNAYTSGATISFDGVQVAVSGVPDNGDAFTVAPSTNQSVFATIANAISLLETAPPAGTATPRISVGLMQSMAGMDAAFKQLQTTHTEVGAALAELDVLASVNANMTVIYGQQQSKQIDIDYVAAISELTIGQQALTAAQQSYAMVTKLSLFNYL